MFKMRGLTLLCFLGLFLTASTGWPPGSHTPMSSGRMTFNSTNSSTVPEEHGPDNTSAQWDATLPPTDNSQGSPALPDGEDTQLPTGGSMPQGKNPPTSDDSHVSEWHFLKHNSGFEPEPTGQAIQEKQT